MNAGAYINLPDRNGDTNLIHASKAGHFSIVDALIRKYADIDLPGAVSNFFDNLPDNLFYFIFM